MREIGRMLNFKQILKISPWQPTGGVFGLSNLKYQKIYLDVDVLNLSDWN